MGAERRTVVGTILIMGIGNTLLSDEGAGLHLLSALQSRHPQLPHVRYLDAGTLGFTLAGDVASAEGLIAIDAAKFSAPPGALLCLEGEAMDRFLSAGKLSVHEVGLADLLDMARLTGDLPERRALVGIQPATTDWDTQPSAPVAAAVPLAVAKVLELVESWTGSAAAALAADGRAKLETPEARP